MNLESFKNSCREVYPNCTFEHHSIVGLAAYIPGLPDCEYPFVASFNDGSVNFNCEIGTVCFVKRNVADDGGHPIFEYVEVSEENFLEKLVEAKWIK